MRDMAKVCVTLVAYNFDLPHGMDCIILPFYIYVTDRLVKSLVN